MDEVSDEKELIVEAPQKSTLVEKGNLGNGPEESEEPVPLRTLSSRQDDYSNDQVTNVRTQRSVTSDKGQQDHDETAMKTAARRLRMLLRIYFHPAFKLEGTKCTVNMLHCILFIAQIVKLTLITLQMFNFGEDRGHFGSIVNRGEITLRHLLLEGWNSDWEDLPYPPNHGDFAVYDIDELTKRINYAVERYYNVENVAIGFYVRLPENDTISAKIQCFDFSQCDNCSVGRQGALNLSSLNFSVDKGLTAHTNSTTNVTTYTYDIMKEFGYYNLEEPIKRLLLLTMTFTLHSVRIFDEGNEALCLSVAGELTFSDLDNNGQVIIDLSTVSSKIKCADLKLEINDWSLQRASKNLATGVIVVCGFGLIITIVIVIFAVFVFTQTKMFMHKYYRHYYKPENDDERDLPATEYFRFVLPWDLCATLADCLTLYGTVKISFRNERRQIDLYELDLFTIWLAVGCFLAWFNILRFVKFYDKFRLLFVTVYRATPNVLAYIVCVAVLYTGFFVVGYVVLAPYHIKFATPSKASETLTAMVNGDEIYATFGILQAEDYGLIWWFFRIYLWSYIAVFTIVVLNLLVAIFMSAYDTVKDNSEKEEDDNQDFGPVEKALIEFLENPHKNNFRSSLSDLMSSNHKFDSVEERTLRTQLSKICRVSTTGDDVILVKPRTLKAFMAEDYDAEEFEFRCMKFSFITIFQKD